MKQIAELNPNVEFSALLIGSVARGTDSERSDVDIVVLSEQPLSRPRCDPRMHVQAFTYESFRQKLRDGDDFVAWSVRFGIPLSGSGEWKTIASSSDASIWPDWKRKIPHAGRRLILASDLLRIGDLPASNEETLYALAHTSRALLLKGGIFPLSRQEMVSQLVAQGHRTLADLLQRSLLQNDDMRSLYRTIRYLKRLLVDLDRTTFGAFAAKCARDDAARTASRHASSNGAT